MVAMQPPQLKFDPLSLLLHYLEIPFVRNPGHNLGTGGGNKGWLIYHGNKYMYNIWHQQSPTINNQINKLLYTTCHLA